MSNSLANIPTNKKKTTDGMTYDFSIGDMLYSTMKILMEWSKVFFSSLCPLVNSSVKLLPTNSPTY